MTPEEREALGLPPSEPKQYVVDAEFAAIRWFWRGITLLTLLAMLALWARIDELRAPVRELDADVSTLLDEVRTNRAFDCRILYAQEALDPEGPCYEPAIFELWAHYAVGR